MGGAWREILIDNKIFCRHYFTSGAAMNIIVTHTPIITTSIIGAAYEPLAHYDVNLFAFDFSGTGKSQGGESEFSLKSVLSDFRLIMDYITANYSDNIHIFGHIGIGGMFAQYYVCSGTKAKSFAQFACAIPKETKAFGYPCWAAKLALPIMKTFPHLTITFKEPKYSGFHAELDNSFYQMLACLAPNFRKCKTGLIAALVESIVSNQSEFQNSIECPTLVFKTLHDRYFPPAYFDRYYDGLQCEKKMIEIDDVHNSYYFSSKLFCDKAYDWFMVHQ